MSLMAALGRILQVVGWIWLAAGVVGQFFDFPVDDVFPGIILLIASRFIRAQAARNASTEDLSVSTIESGPRPLNTDRPSTSLPKEPPPPAKLAPAPPNPAPKPQPRQAEDTARDELLEDFLYSGREMVDDAVADPVEPEAAGQKSSADMIADAKKRWSKRP
jgi:hypothetical protein